VIFSVLSGKKDSKLEKVPTGKANEPDPGGSDQQNLGYEIQPYGQFFSFLLFCIGKKSQCQLFFSFRWFKIGIS